jgi:hypothetical protein
MPEKEKPEEIGGSAYPDPFLILSIVSMAVVFARPGFPMSGKSCGLDSPGKPQFRVAENTWLLTITPGMPVFV